MLIYLGLFALGFVFVLASAVLADVFDSGEVDPGGGDIALVSVFSPRIVAAATAGFGAGGALGLMLGLLAIAVLWMGLDPKPFTDVMDVSVAELLKHVALSKLPQ